MHEKMTPSDKEEKDETLHHAGDKSFKAIMKVKESALEYVQQFFPTLYALLDLTFFELDSTNYIAKEFSEFYSDVVYRTQLKDDGGKKKKSIAVVLLFEHKKRIRSYFALFLQLLEYIIFIWKEDIANKRKPSIIVPLVFFQGTKGLRYKEMHDCFKGIPKDLLPFIPNFKCHVTNVHDLSSNTITSLDEKGLLRSLFLAYTYKERKTEINNILIEVFRFFQYDPEKLDFFRLLFDFIAQEDYLSADEINELMTQFTSPKIKDNMMTSAQVWKQEGKEQGKVEGKVEGKIEGKIEKARFTVLRGRLRGLTAEFLADISELPIDEVENMLIGYDQVHANWSKKQKIETVEHLSESEVKYLWDLFNKNQN